MQEAVQRGFSLLQSALEYDLREDEPRAPELPLGAASLACCAVARAGSFGWQGLRSRRLRVAGQVVQHELVDTLGVFEFGDMLGVGQ